jgi:hypothetical protein
VGESELFKHEELKLGDEDMRGDNEDDDGELDAFVM